MGVQDIFVVDPKTERAYKYLGGDLRLCATKLVLDASRGSVDWTATASLRDE